MALSNLTSPGSRSSAKERALAAAITVRELASGYGGVVVVAYFSALCDLRYTATHYARLRRRPASWAASPRTTAGALIESSAISTSTC